MQPEILDAIPMYRDEIQEERITEPPSLRQMGCRQAPDRPLCHRPITSNPLLQRLYLPFPAGAFAALRNAQQPFSSTPGRSA